MAETKFVNCLRKLIYMFIVIYNDYIIVVIFFYILLLCIIIVVVFIRSIVIIIVVIDSFRPIINILFGRNAVATLKPQRKVSKPKVIGQKNLWACYFPSDGMYVPVRADVVSPDAVTIIIGREDDNNNPKVLQ